MALASAGILVFRRTGEGPQFLLGHPGGPRWSRKDMGAWMIPKGRIAKGETALDAAHREFVEETGIEPPILLRALSPVVQAGGKTVFCWAAEGDLDLAAFHPGEFEMEWPPRSGQIRRFPELDRIAYFDPPAALEHILPSQAPILCEVLAWLEGQGG